MRNTIRLCVAVLLSCLPATAPAADIVYVQSLVVKLTVAPSFAAATVAEARRGEALEVLESRDHWHKVRMGNRTGWLPSLVVAHRAPLSRSSALDEEAARGATVNARRRASAATTAGAARGLTYEDRLRASDAGLANYAALERVETFSVTEQEALAFVAAGLHE